MALLGLATGIASMFRSLFLSLSGEALTSRLRRLSFQHMLHQVINNLFVLVIIPYQDTNWFDDPKNSTGKLTTQLSHDVTEIQGVSWQSIPQTLWNKAFLFDKCKLYFNTNITSQKIFMFCRVIACLNYTGCCYIRVSLFPLWSGRLYQ